MLFENYVVVCFPKTLDICRTSIRPGIDAQAWVTHTHNLSHTLFFTAIMTGLDISFDPTAPPLCCLLIIYWYAVTRQTPSAEKWQKVRVKISFGIIAWKESAKLAFSSIIDVCLQTMHNAGSCVYDNHVLNIMFWGVLGYQPALFQHCN